MCLHVSLVYCVLCIVSRVSLVSHYHHPTYLYVHSVRGRDARWGWEPSVLCALCSVICGV